MNRSPGAIPRWLSLANLLAMFITLAIVVPKQIHAATSVPIPAPHDLRISTHPDPASAWLEWQDDSKTSTTSYILERSQASDFSSSSQQMRISKNTLDYIDETGEYNTTFYYRVFSVVGDAMSPPSNVVANHTWSRTRPYAPWAPYNPHVTRSGNGFQITWSSNATNESGIWIWRSSDSGATWETRASLSFGTLSYFDDDPPEAAPIYHIVNFNEGGTGISEGVQYLDPYVQTPAVTSYIPSNVTQYVSNVATLTALASNVGSLVPGAQSIVSSYSKVVSSYTGVVTNLGSVGSVAASIASNYTGIASNYTGIASNVTGVVSNAGSIPASLTSVAMSEESFATHLVPSIGIPNVGSLESSIQALPSAYESFVINEQPKVWIGLRDANGNYAPGVWLAPVSCVPTICGQPPHSQADFDAGRMTCLSIIVAYSQCIYRDTTPGPPPTH